MTLKQSQTVTVSCCQGNDGIVYQGLIPWHKTETDLTGMVLPKLTKMMINIGISVFYMCQVSFISLEYVDHKLQNFQLNTLSYTLFLSLDFSHYAFPNSLTVTISHCHPITFTITTTHCHLLLLNHR